MKITIDAFNIALAHGTGVATYGRNLARAAGGLGHDVGILFGTRAGHSKVPLLNEIALAEGDPRSDKPSVPLVLQGLWHAAKGLSTSRTAREVPISGQVIMPHGLQFDRARMLNVRNLYRSADFAFRGTGAFTRVKLPGVDLAHWTYPMPIQIPGARNVYTLHDLVPLRLPYTTADVKRAYYRLCRHIARDADHILTVSECSRRDIVEMLGVDEARVSNLYQSSDMAQMIAGVSPEQISSHVEGLIGVPAGGYYLFFGAIEPKKNIARMVEAYLGSGSGRPLLIVGAPGWGSERDATLLKSMISLDNRKRIIWLTYLPRDMLARLIAGARATLFPSLYEGFGLPVLESIALGTPVVTSDVSSLPEVAGDAALYVNPYDVGSISAAIRTMDSDDDLRADLSAKGFKQAEQFSLDAYRERLESFYGTIR
jgi:glycosyltransferase involved in cell wall biosynthesis